MRIKKIAYISSTLFGIGYFPIAPGTAASLVAALIFWITPLSTSLWILLCLLLFFTGIWAANLVEADKGKDPGIIVIDELVGQWIALLFLPKTWIIIVIAFGLFRVFDIVKPFPARKFETAKGGLGVMSDDVIAGIYTNIIIQVYLYF